MPRRYTKIVMTIIFKLLFIACIIIATIYLLPQISKTTSVVLVIFVVSLVTTISLNLACNIYLNAKQEKLYAICEKEFNKCKKLYQIISEEISDYYTSLENLDINKTIKCSYSVVSNATANEIKYILKYSNIDYSVEDLEAIDSIKIYLKDHEAFIHEMSKCKYKILTKIPFFFRPFINKDKIAYDISQMDFESSEIDYAEMIFRYVSPAGRSCHSHVITITKDKLDELSQNISERIGKTGHTKAQRSKMTKDLREAIKKRDDYTCQICGNNVLQEPNLLLEVDHIVPIAKGGKTEASNLQTLCWRCNREKHDK